MFKLKLEEACFKKKYSNLPYLSAEYPMVYNSEGKPMKRFYLKDDIMPIYSGSKYFLWDRCNYGLNVHFYSQGNMMITRGAPLEKYGLLVESRQIATNDYNLFEKKRGLEKEFRYIFTFDDGILNRYENARFFPACAKVWYGRKGEAYEWDDKAYLKKTRGVSIVSSDKKMCHLHEVRIQISKYCKQHGIADTFGTFDGGQYSLIDDSLREYRYSIIVENDVSDYFFTEKLTNCFAAHTIPIYLGARKIEQFFNADGIIRVEERQLERLDEILTQCTPEFYQERLDAVLDNYKRVFRYQNLYDLLYENYFIE